MIVDQKLQNSTKRSPPPQEKKLTFSQKGPMIIQWQSLDFNCVTGFWSLQLFSSYVPVPTNIWSKINTTWKLWYRISKKGEYYNPAETLVNGHFLGVGESWISRWKRFGCWETDLCWGTFNLPVQFSLLILSSWGTGGNIDHPIDTESITAKNNHYWVS